MHDVRSLSTLIENKLSPLFDKCECVLLDAPYYENVGDILIFEGECAFLQKIGVKIKSVSSYNTFNFKSKIDTNIIIAINGGGNMGDIYSEHMSFLKRIAKKYIDNKIIVFPQTIFYNNEDKAESDFKELKKHSNLYFCSRDFKGYELLKKFYIKEKSLMLPDMAFCINVEKIKNRDVGLLNNVLYIQRKDKEKSIKFNIDDNASCIISDWPSFQYSIRKESIVAKILNNLYDKIPNLFIGSIINIIWDKYFSIHKKMMMREGISFISPYSVIHTTRLHGAILSILLGKKVYIYNNSYGKNFEFYNSWLMNMPNVYWME